jgi:stigma-specific protein Stig1
MTQSIGTPRTIWFPARAGAPRSRRAALVAAAALILLPTASFADGGSLIVPIVTVYPTLFPVNDASLSQSSYAFVCTSNDNPLSSAKLHIGDAFAFTFEGSIGTQFSVVAPLLVNSATLVTTDFTESVSLNALNQAVLQVKYTDSWDKYFAGGDSVCAKILFKPSGAIGSGQITTHGPTDFYRFAPALPPYVTETIGDFAAAPGALKSITAGTGLVESGTSPNITLGIAPGGVTFNELASGAVTSNKLAQGAVMTSNIMDGAVTRGKIATGNAVTSVNAMTDAVILVAGSGVSITPTANTLNSLTFTAPGTFTAGGDLSGTPTSQQVSKLQGTPLSLTPGTGTGLTGTVIGFNSVTGNWSPVPGFAAGGDLMGTATNQTVSKIQGAPFSLPPNTGTSLTGSVIGWNGFAYTSIPGFAAAGDLTGTATSQQVSRLQGTPLSLIPGTGNSLTGTVIGFNSGAWMAVPGFSAGGDLTGGATNQIVSRIQSVPFSLPPNTGTNLNGSVLGWTGTAYSPIPGFSPGGDLSGSATNQLVNKLQGFPLALGGTGAPAAGQVLAFNGTGWVASTAPAGPQGPVGPQGPQGPAGPPGSAANLSGAPLFFTAYFGNPLNSNAYTAGKIVPDDPITITRVTAELGSAGDPSCSSAVLRLGSESKGEDVYITGNQTEADSGSAMLTFPAGANLRASLRSGTVCASGAVPGNANLIVEYRTQISGDNDTCPGGQTTCSGFCENTALDPSNCGACGASCYQGQFCTNGTCAGSITCTASSQCPNLPNSAGPTCSSGICLSACNPGFADCNHNPTDGCETNLTFNSQNCGACGNVCPTGQTCSNSTCVPAGQVTCSPTTACPTEPNTSFPSCQNGTCIWACTTGFADCDHNALNGCETNITSDAKNCGGCGITCAQGQACVGGACSASTCTDGIKDGNETGIDCGGGTCPPCAVGQTCLAGSDCQSGICTGGVCATSCGAGMTACGNACAPLHSNGLGQFYIDCSSPLGTPGNAATYNQAMALDAASVFSASGPSSLSCNGAGAVGASSAQGFAVWIYQGALAGHVLVSPTALFCPISTDPVWN